MSNWGVQGAIGDLVAGLEGVLKLDCLFKTVIWSAAIEGLAGF